MKEIKSKIQPNHREYQIWIDLNEDPHGSVKKHWDGVKWVKTEDNNTEQIHIEIEDIKKSIALLFDQIANLKLALNNVKQYDDTKVHDRINKLINRVNKLESFIVTE